MTTTSSDDIPKEPEGETETEGNSKPEKKDVDWFSRAADLVNRVPVPRLFLTLSLFAYGVVAFSKKENGVQLTDLSYLIIYIVVVIFLFVLLIALRDVYRYKQKDIAKSICKIIFKK